MTGDVAPEPTDDAQPPDAIEPIAALRVWSADPEMLLHSLNDETTWTPGEWMTARCSRREHPAPQEGCTCGFYATKERDGAPDLTVLVFVALIASGARKPRTAPRAIPSNDHPEPGFVIGRVHLAGKVIEHADGYRAERARVAEILPVAGWNQGAELVAEAYGVPLGEELPALPLPDFDSRSHIGIACSRPSTEPLEPTVIGMLSILAFSLPLFVGAVLGNHGKPSSRRVRLVPLPGRHREHACDPGGDCSAPRRDAESIRGDAGTACPLFEGPPCRRARQAPSLLRRPAVTGDIAPERPDRYEAESASDAGVPDAIEPIIGYRVWRTDSYGRLHSFNHPGAWMPGRWTVARCARDGRVAPLEGCTCGLYATKELDDVLALAGTIDTADAIVGRVQLAGKVIEHAHGYRAELARVTDILPIEGQRARIEPVVRRFGVPIGEEIPASLIRTVRREGPRSSASTGRSARTAAATRSSGTPRAAESLPWLFLVFAQITFNSLAAGMKQYDWSDWRLPAAIVGSIVAVGVWIFVRVWMGHRFSRQLRSFVSAPRKRPP